MNKMGWDCLAFDPRCVYHTLYKYKENVFANYNVIFNPLDGLASYAAKFLLQPGG